MEMSNYGQLRMTQHMGQFPQTGDLLHLSDYDLIASWKNGCDAAFEQLMVKYEKKLFSFCRKYINDLDECSDIVQEVFIKAYRKLDNFKPEYRFSTWIFTIATNACIDYYRKNKKHVDLVPIDDSNGSSAPVGYHVREIADSCSDPEQKCHEKMFSEDLEEKLGDLPEILRSAFTLKEYFGNNYSEISELLGVPLNTVKSRIFQARKKLVHRMDAYAP